MGTTRSRRRLLHRSCGIVAWLAMPALLPGVRAAAPSARRLTPSQTEGPFFPRQLPTDSDGDLMRVGTRSAAQGQATWLEGQVTDLQGRPVRGARVEIWQCDRAGHYHHPGDGDAADPDFQGFGHVMVDADGRYRFHTLRPAPYSGRTPHIHVKVRLAARELLTTQVYVEDEPGNVRDGLWQSLRDPTDRAALTVAFRQLADGALQARFPIVVAA